MSVDRLVRAGVVAMLAVALAGCTATEQPRQLQRPTHSVIVPGGPGEPATKVPADRAGRLAKPSKPSAADLRFMQQMLTHHQQAIVMTDLAPGRVSDPAVRGMAARIADAQRPEITAMQGWLRKHGQHEGHGEHQGHGQHGHHMGHGQLGAQPIQMSGMATEAQLAQLRAARGPDYDQLFLRLMITHHEGAVRMARDLLTLGSADPSVERFAQDVIVTQTDEIGRMRAMQTG